MAREPKDTIARVKKNIRKHQEAGAEEIVLTNPDRKSAQKKRQLSAKKKSSKKKKSDPDRSTLNEQVVLQDPDKNLDHGLSKKQTEHSKTRFVLFSGVAIAMSGIILFFINPYVSFSLGMLGAIGVIIAIFVDF